MRVIRLSRPETILLWNVLRPQLIAAVTGRVTMGVLIVGYIPDFNM
jgi:hypothetical protein